MTYVIPPWDLPAIPIKNSDGLFPVRRIYCVGQNYAAHTKEMGGDPEREIPFFFSKPPDALVIGGGEVPYPGKTTDLHHEVELVIAMSSEAEILGYAVGLDLTRRDLQTELKKKGRPWEMSKGFDNSAPISSIVTKEEAGDLRDRGITCRVNDDVRQDGNLNQMIWNVDEVISHLGSYLTIKSGDLIFTGTPAGVSAVEVGDRVRGEIEGIGCVEITIV